MQKFSFTQKLITWKTSENIRVENLHPCSNVSHITRNQEASLKLITMPLQTQATSVSWRMLVLLLQGTDAGIVCNRV